MEENGSSSALAPAEGTRTGAGFTPDGGAADGDTAKGVRGER